MTSLVELQTLSPRFASLVWAVRQSSTQPASMPYSSHCLVTAAEHCFELEPRGDALVLRLVSADGTNRLTRARVEALTAAIEHLVPHPPSRLILTGNSHFFSAGADLNEIAALTGPEALGFAGMGQCLMNAVANFPAATIAAIQGYCMGGGLDLALACDCRIAGAHAMLGHRGAALGLITGWGGTQRLPRIVGKARALQMFLAADRISAPKALEIGLVSAIAPDPVAHALQIPMPHSFDLFE
jgi:enoyl-CoA hydratase/carnithine racemase